MLNGEFTLIPEPDGTGYRPKLSGEPPQGARYALINIFHFSSARQVPVFVTRIPIEHIGEVFDAKINNLIDGEVYGVYIGFTDEDTFYWYYDPSALPYAVYISVDKEIVKNLPVSVGVELMEKHLKVQEEPWIVNDADPGRASRFKIVIFYTGIDIHVASKMRGVRFFPILPGVGNKNYFDAVRDFLSINFDSKLNDDISFSDGLQFQPLYAVELCNVIANSELEAINYSRNLGFDISTLIAVERGDRPTQVMTYIRNEEDRIWRIIPTPVDFRGNLVAPFEEVASGVERHLDRIRSQPRSKLILELYVQSIAERDWSFKFFRQWALLETISSNIKRTREPILDLNGVAIFLGSGKELTTEKSYGRIYTYLRGTNLPTIRKNKTDGSVSQIEGSVKSDFSADEEFSLWEAVSASNKIRDEVGHEGKFKVDPAATNRIHKLANRLFLGEFNFLRKAVACAVWTEIYRKPSARE